MAQDQVEVMRQLGHTSFMVAGHDRGGRVAARLCMDHPDVVQKVALLDIAPTLTMYKDTDKLFATKYFWWFFADSAGAHAGTSDQSGPGVLSALPSGGAGKDARRGHPEAMAEYIRCYCCKGTIHAVCEDYRAGAGIDLDDDRRSEDSNQNIEAPLLALWGQKGTVSLLWDVLETWRHKSIGSVSGKGLPCGHLLQEEQPEAVLSAFQDFFRT